MTKFKSPFTFLKTSRRRALALALPATLFSSIAAASPGEVVDTSDKMLWPIIFPCFNGSMTVMMFQGEDGINQYPCYRQGGLAEHGDPAYTPGDNFVCEMPDSGVLGGSPGGKTSTKTTVTNKKSAPTKGLAPEPGDSKHVGVNPNFVQPCDVEIVCVNGEASCAADQQAMLVNAFPLPSSEDLTIENIGIAHNRALHIMTTQFDDILARGGVVDDKTLEAVYSWSGNKITSGVQKSLLHEIADLDKIRDLIDDEDMSFFDQVCDVEPTKNIGGKPSASCSTDLADLIRDYRPLLMATTSPAELQSALDALEADAFLSLEGDDLDAALVYVRVARDSLAYWVGFPTKAAWPPRWVIADAIGALTGGMSGGWVGALVSGALASLTESLEDDG